MAGPFVIPFGHSLPPLDFVLRPHQATASLFYALLDRERYP